MIRLTLLLMALSAGFAVARPAQANQCSALFERIEFAHPHQALEMAQQAQAARQAYVARLVAETNSYFSSVAVGKDEFYFNVDRDSALTILRKLALYGSDTDLQIYDTFLSIYKSTKVEPVRHVNIGGRINLRGGRRPSPRLESGDLSWTEIDSFFFDTPTVLTSSKQESLRFLKHVLQTARTSSTPRPFLEVVREADRSWHLAQLQNERRLLGEYLAFEKGRSFDELHDELTQHLEKESAEILQDLGFKKEPGPSDSWRGFMRGTSTFDLFLAKKYFELTVRLSGSTHSKYHHIDTQSLPPNWHFTQVGLRTGSPDFMIDFLMRSAHDTKLKAYLWRILDRMEPQAGSSLSFSEAFDQAKAQVDHATIIKAPDGYEADLHVFHISGSRGGLGKDANYAHAVWEPQAEEVKVHWNEQLGRLEEELTDSVFLKDQPDRPVSSNPKIKKFLTQYFKLLRDQNIYSHEQVEQFEQAELATPIARVTYLVFTEPGTGELLAMVRIFNANEINYIERFRVVKRIAHPETNIELEYGLTLPERPLKIPIYELGRLLGTEKAAHSFDALMARVADYLQTKNASGVAYVEGPRDRTIFFRRKGAEIEYTPQQLPLKPSDIPVWVSKMSIGQLIQRFKAPNYETVRQRRLTTPRSSTGE